MTSLPPTLDVETILERLEIIFPEGTPGRRYLTTLAAAKTVFVMLYAGAYENSGRWIRPNQVVRMTDNQAASTSNEQREAWLTQSMEPSSGNPTDGWYAVNTRESIRDEALRQGLIPTGAAIEREGLPTTSSLPRYALSLDFLKLLEPNLSHEELQTEITAWQQAHLTAAALTSITLTRQGTTASEQSVPIRLPNGEVRIMQPGPSSLISKAVIEEFASRYLRNPALIWLSESRTKVIEQQDQLARDLGINLSPDGNLPDIILADVVPTGAILVFVEVVASTGPVTEQRRSDLLKIATDAGFTESNIAFVSAFENRRSLRGFIEMLAWRSFAWLRTEPDSIIAMYRREAADGSAVLLSELLRE